TLFRSACSDPFRGGTGSGGQPWRCHPCRAIAFARLALASAVELADSAWHPHHARSRAGGGRRALGRNRRDHPAMSLRDFWIALQFMTRLPTPRVVESRPDDLARASPWFPAAGLVIG